MIFQSYCVARRSAEFTANIARAYPTEAKGWGAFVDSFQSQYVGKDQRFVLWSSLRRRHGNVVFQPREIMQ